MDDGSTTLPGTRGWTTTRSTTDNLALRTATVGAYARSPLRRDRIGLKRQRRPSAAVLFVLDDAANLAACDVRNSAAAVTALNGTTGGTGATFNVTANNFKHGQVTKPAAGWTPTEVNAVRFRFGGCTSADISPVPTAQAMMLEVDWPVAPAVLHPGQHHRRPGGAMQRRSVASTRAGF